MPDLIMHQEFVFSLGAPSCYLSSLIFLLLSTVLHSKEYFSVFEGIPGYDTVIRKCICLYGESYQFFCVSYGDSKF